MTDALIHLRVPAELKARWVRESRAAGMRITEWIVQRVERPGEKNEHESQRCTQDTCCRRQKV